MKGWFHNGREPLLFPGLLTAEVDFGLDAPEFRGFAGVGNFIARLGVAFSTIFP
ncbi:MAG: hypothetical protein V4527_16075 [Pseudomonadota bacterium]